MAEWTTRTGLSLEEFARFTRYCNASDNLTDNINRAKALGITSRDVKVAPGAIIRTPERLKVGDNVFIGLYVYINADVIIGDNVLIGPHCSLSANNHVFDPDTQWFSKGKAAPIVIGNGTWLAAGCMVTAGVTIGRCNLVCANAVVTKDTPDYAIVAGTPARQVGHIDGETGDYHWYGDES